VALFVYNQLFFGKIRYAAGCEDHPTAATFVKLYRLLSVYSLLRLPRRRGNTAAYTTQPQLPVASCHQPSKRAHSVSAAAECIDSLLTFSADDDVELEEDVVLSTLSTRDNIVYYVAGYVVRHCKRVMHCTLCLEILQLPTGASVNEPFMALIKQKMRGALIWPSISLFRALCNVDSVVCRFLDVSTPDVFSSIVEDSLPAMLPLSSCLCESHRSWLAAEILVYYVATRLHWHARSVNKEVSSRKQVKDLRKKAKLC
jgi:hypothetical protein